MDYFYHSGGEKTKIMAVGACSGGIYLVHGSQ